GAPPPTGAAGPAAPGVTPETATAPTIAPTEAELARGIPIAKVVITGNRRIATDEIATYFQQTRVGKPFTPEGLAKDVNELWGSGYMEDVEVDLTRADDGVHIRILVREKPSIKSIEFSGNSKIDNDDLTEALSVEVKVGSILSYAA